VRRLSVSAYGAVFLILFKNESENKSY